MGLNSWISSSGLAMLAAAVAALAPVASAPAQSAPATVMDNGQAGTSFTGNWRLSSSGSPHGGTALYTTRGTYTFQPRLAPGSYEVKLHWPLVKSRLASRVHVVVDTPEGPQDRYFTQRSGAGRWNRLGTFDLDTASSVRFLARNTYPVCVDAVSFQRLDDPEPEPPVDEPPAAPAAMQATAEAHGIRLDWADSPDDDFAGFSVFRSANDTRSFTALATGVRTSAYLDTGVEVGTMYHYFAVAHDAGGNESAPSATASAVLTDQTAPPAPVGVQAVAAASAIQLDWADSPAADLAGYSVYRSLNAGAGFQVAAVGLIASAAVDPTAVAGTTYYYYVTAVDDAGNESARSAVVTARIAPPAPPPAPPPPPPPPPPPAPPPPSPPPPPAPRSLTLGWTQPAVNADGTQLRDLAGYRIYRGSAPGSLGSPLDVGQVLEHTFPSLAPGNHYFAVTAYDTNGNESTHSTALFVRLE